MEIVTKGNGAVLITPTAFGEFYDRAAKDVFAYLVRGLLGDRATAEDLTQETFAAVVVAVRSGRAEALTMPWVIGVARHKIIDHYRRVARDARHLAMVGATTDAAEIDPTSDADPAQVLEMLRHLSPEHQLVLLLRYVEDLPVHQVAATLGRSTEATSSLLSRARRALAARLAENSS
ncbi:MAG TPA: sigma-70 family RNA polymerase sigma factor [Ilumatobacteraceae bacterium]|nr:sigma-70 family RNA polymerase sigma factor [Ilumatobacteraceae bacterium]